jgi:hypothetical protein
MAERIVPLLSTQVARVRFLVPARPTIRLEMAFFCTTASGGTFLSTVVEILNWFKKNCSSASEGVPHRADWVRLGRGILHKGHKSVLQLRYSNE